MADDAALAAANIRSWYEAGLPFFTKDRLRFIHEQIQELNGDSGMIFVPNLRSHLVEAEWVVDKVRTHPGRADLERVVQGDIVYKPIEMMLSPRPGGRPYENIVICERYGPFRDRHTKEPIQQLQLRSQHETEVYFQSVLVAWMQSRQRQDLVALLKAEMHLSVKKVIAFANATMTETSESEGDVYSLRAAYQHALLLTLRDVFTQDRDTSEEVLCYAQNPGYTDIDKAVLQQHKVEVVEDPGGFLEVDDDTAVFSHAPDPPVKQIVCDIASPALLIWNTMTMPVRDEVYDGPSMNDSRETTIINTVADPMRLVKMIDEKYKRFNFPEGLEEYFGRISIYVRKDQLASTKTVE